MFLNLWVRWRNRKLKPGQRCPVSGQYTFSKEPHPQCTMVEGEIMPPCRGHRNGYWTLSDVTRHKR
jgi:hypothetical protein